MLADPSDVRLVHFLAFVPEWDFGMSEDDYLTYASSREPRSLTLAKLSSATGWSSSLHVLTSGRARMCQRPPLGIPIRLHPLAGRRTLSRVRSWPIAGPRSRRFYASGHLARWLTANPASIVFFRGNVHARFSRRLAARMQRMGIPYVYEHHALDVPSHPRLLPFFRNASTVVTLTEPTRRAFVEECGLSEDRVVTIGNGVDIDLFTPTARSQEAYPRLAFVGMLTPAKGLDLAVEALRRIRARWPEAVLEVAGNPLASSAGLLAALADGLPPGAVVVHGWLGTTDLQALLARADVLLFPSRPPAEGGHEGEPRTVLEAMASGVPVVAVDSSGLHAEIIKASAAGATATATATFPAAAAAYLEDPSLVESHRQRARDYVVAHHSVDAATTAYRALCARLLP